MGVAALAVVVFVARIVVMIMWVRVLVTMIVLVTVTMRVAVIVPVTMIVPVREVVMAVNMRVLGGTPALDSHPDSHRHDRKSGQNP